MNRKELLVAIKELNKDKDLLAKIDEKKIIVVGIKTDILIRDYKRIMIKLDDAGLTDEVSENCIDFFEENLDEFMPKKDAEKIEEETKEELEQEPAEEKEEPKEESEEKKESFVDELSEETKKESVNEELVEEEPEKELDGKKQVSKKGKKEKKKTGKKVEKKAEAFAKKKEGKDVFGFGVGTQNNQFMLTIKESPKTMKQIKEMPWNKKKGTFYNVFNKLKGEGIVDKNENNEMFIK